MTNKVDNTQVAIQRFEATEPERILDVRASISGYNITEATYRKYQATQLVVNIRQAPLSCMDTEIVYRKRFESTVKFCLPITTFRKK